MFTLRPVIVGGIIIWGWGVDKFYKILVGGGGGGGGRKKSKFGQKLHEIKRIMADFGKSKIPKIVS